MAWISAEWSMILHVIIYSYWLILLESTRSKQATEQPSQQETHSFDQLWSRPCSMVISLTSRPLVMVMLVLPDCDPSYLLVFWDPLLLFLKIWRPHFWFCQECDDAWISRWDGMGPGCKLLTLSCQAWCHWGGNYYFMVKHVPDHRFCSPCSPYLPIGSFTPWGSQRPDWNFASRCRWSSSGRYAKPGRLGSRIENALLLTRPWASWRRQKFGRIRKVFSWYLSQAMLEY